MYRIRNINHDLKHIHWLSPLVRCLSAYTAAHPPRRVLPYLQPTSNRLSGLSHPSREMASPQDKMPPGHEAAVGNLETFCLPNNVEVTTEHIAMGKAMVKALQRTSIFQIQATTKHQDVFEKCLTASQDFFNLSMEEKTNYVDDQSFSGYIASGEELTAGVADYSEVFTVTKELLQTDPRVQAHWPCHGPCPWPHVTYKHSMLTLMELLKDTGDKLLQLTALGLGLDDMNTLKDLTQDGWHHMRSLRFPALNQTNGKTKSGRGIGSHTDYGLLVIAAPDTTGGDFVRPRCEGESVEEWQASAAGADEDDNDEKWLFVPPIENTMTVFPGDMMQLLTNGVLAATPHKVALNTTERYAFAYFHEPNFNTVIETLPEFRTRVHYGSHFTKQFMSNYPDRITSERIRDENRLDVLGEIRRKAISASFQQSARSMT